MPQFAAPRTIRPADLSTGAWLIATGLFKKIVIADNLSPMVDAVFAPAFPAAGGDVLIACYAFALQIYGDFAGYSDMARGLSQLLGIELNVNFRFPYAVTNPREFWRHWHISLSTWLRDYLYIPLGGNRRGERRTYVNLMAVMLLGGLWHGASWTFVGWGLYHGLLLAAFRSFGRYWDRLYRPLQGIGTFILASDDSDEISRWGEEVAPALREAVSAERGSTPAAPGCRGRAPSTCCVRRPRPRA